MLSELFIFSCQYCHHIYTNHCLKIVSCSLPKFLFISIEFSCASSTPPSTLQAEWTKPPPQPEWTKLHHSQMQRRTAFCHLCLKFMWTQENGARHLAYVIEDMYFILVQTLLLADGDDHAYCSYQVHASLPYVQSSRLRLQNVLHSRTSWPSCSEKACDIRLIQPLEPRHLQEWLENCSFRV